MVGAVVSLLGCGGSGGSTGGTLPASVSAKTAVIVASQGAVLYQGAAVSTAAAFRPAIQSVSVVTPLYAWLASAARQAGSAEVVPASWTPIGGTGLYFETGTISGLSTTLLLSTNGTSNNAGTLTVTLKSLPGVFPEKIGLNLNLILPSQTITATGQITLNDNSGKNYTMTLTVASSLSNVTLSVTLTNVNGDPSVAMTVHKGSVTIVYVDVKATDSGLTASFTVTGVTGTVNLNADGSGSAQADDGTGQWTITWDMNESATLTSPTGVTVTGALGSLSS